LGARLADRSKDVEILVLRHQLQGLPRQTPGPRLRRRDRLPLAAASRVPPRAWMERESLPPGPSGRAHQARWTYAHAYRRLLAAAVCRRAARNGDPRRTMRW